MLKVELMRGGDGAMIARLWWCAGEAACATVELSGRACGLVAPRAGRIRHETDAVGAIAVVETFDLDRPMLLRELRGESDIAERIAAGGAFEGDFVETPLFDVGRPCGGDNWLCGEDFRVQGGGQGGGRSELQDISAVHWILSPANLI